MAVITFPTDEEIKAAFDEYALALGNVAHTWNYLQESLGRLFVSVTGMPSKMAFSIWYSTKSDAAQRNMLRAAMKSLPNDHWKKKPKIPEEIAWILKTADDIGQRRNDAIHSPCTIATNEKGHKMYPSFFNGNLAAIGLRARIKGEDVLSQFKWYSESAETLYRYTQDITTLLFSDVLPLPDRPRMPTSGQRGQKKKVP